MVLDSYNRPLDHPTVKFFFAIGCRVGNTRSREYGGTGLGLSIVKYIGELHGGRVMADSRVGGGTMMRLNLPVRHAAAGGKEQSS